MFYELICQYKIGKEITYLLNKNNHRKYEISGEDIPLFNEVLPYLTGTYSTKNICEYLGINIDDLMIVIKQLNQLELLKESKHSKLTLLLIADEYKQSRSLQDSIINNINLREIDIVLSNIENIEKYKTSYSSTLILCINTFYNNSFIKSIEKESIKNKINFLNITLFGNKNFIGPLFSFEDGPCSECLSKAEIIKNDEFNEPLGNAYKGLSEFIINEIIRFRRVDTYVNTFNTVINVNFSELTIDKLKVLRLPNCIGCRFKQELIQ